MNTKRSDDTTAPANRVRRVALLVVGGLISTALATIIYAIGVVVGENSRGATYDGELDEEERY